jgi:hypothetical protein
MPRPPQYKRKQQRKEAQTKPQKPPKQPPPHFAPSAFLSGSAEAVQKLCDELATLAAERFSDLTGTTWQAVGTSLAEQLRAIGHDLTNFDESPELQEWQATFYHPRGTFSLLLAFRAPHSVEVTWRTDDWTYTASR